MLKYSLNGNILTNSNGVQQLYDFFHFAKKHNDCWFNLDLTNLQFIDANLSAELFLLCHLLKKKNNLKFYIDYQSLNGHLNVLSRNGFAYYTVHNKQNFQPYDNRESIIPLKAFKIEDADGFTDYIENTLLKQRGLDFISTDDKDRIKNSYFEIFDNVGIHSNTDLPIFCCGQYFPNAGELKFTLTDYGDGFLKKIASHTLNDLKITTPSEAISWAVKGGSTKLNNEKGGNGLKRIMMFCIKSGGSLSIVSDGCFWSLENKSITSFLLKNNRKGATIHLVFRFLQK